MYITFVLLTTVWFLFSLSLTVIIKTSIQMYIIKQTLFLKLKSKPIINPNRRCLSIFHFGNLYKRCSGINVYTHIHTRDESMSAGVSLPGLKCNSRNVHQYQHRRLRNLIRKRLRKIIFERIKFNGFRAHTHRITSSYIRKLNATVWHIQIQRSTYYTGIDLLQSSTNWRLDNVYDASVK